ncbi:hypothetical protein Poli38472_014232 [Pythium oligandrum]|uniref:PLD phosphodiesterase domain-containing protein n=1 Tax=Pythium oligandrum TaxID=41045 RepID=A0A8K1CK36_PYTOL|nr:hypothetical protein Poli38472_014232 [Pythium oligandrum]|eukprot:TMW64115.1 hypothetical protein Poli38472_014232 [Pythium oligandrum]
MLDVTRLFSASSVSAAALLLLLSYLSLPSAQQRAVHHLPTPFTGFPFPVLRGTVVMMRTHSRRIYDWLLDNCREFQGKPWRMQVLGRPVTVIVSSVATVEHILKTQFESFVKGRYTTELAFDILGRGIFATDGALWAHQRKTASHLFSLRMMRETMEETVRSHCLVLDAKLTSIAASEEPVVNMKRLLDLFTMDVFTQIGFGIQLNNLQDGGGHHPFLDAFDRSSLALLHRFQQPMWLWRLKKWLNVGVEKQLKTDMKLINGVVEQIVLRSVQEKNDGLSTKPRRDLVSLFVDKMSSSDPETTSPSLIRDMALNFIAAGRDTTSQSMSWFLVMMNRYPNVLNRVCEELQTHLPHLKEDQTTPSMEDVQKLAYLEAAIKESLRLNPVVPVTTRTAATDTALDDGTFLKQGTRVVFSNYVLARMSSVWGDDAETFNPDRWIDSSTGKLKEVSAFQFPVFLAGPRTCLGMKFALMEMKITLAMLLSRFELRTVRDPFAITYKASATLSINGPLEMKVTLRNKHRMGNIFSGCATSAVQDDSSASTTQPLSSQTRGSTHDADRDLSRAEQPALNTLDWFLSTQEITAARGGVPRKDLTVYSSGNHVEAFVSTDDYFERLLSDLEATNGPNDFIWIAGWSLNHKMPLAPRRSNYRDTTLKRVLERAVCQRQVQTRALIWANMLQRQENIVARDWMNGLTGGSAVFLFDNRLPHHVSSHHQKFVVIRKSEELIVYMGGLDITLDRWDTINHDHKAFRQERGLRDAYDGWVDAALRIQGGAVQDVAATFVARWNSSVRPHDCWKEELLDFANPENYAHVPSDAATDAGLVIPQDGSTIVQIVRTFSPHKANELYPELAPKGELSLLQSRIKAIRQARNYVYIEDQYFFFMPQLMDALRSVLPHLLRVIVVVQRPGVSTQSKASGYEKLVYQMARPLLDAFPTKMRIFTTKETRNLYVHTKLLLVDDVFACVSSANWNRRSMTSDSEIGACLLDASPVEVASDNNIRVGPKVRELRLWKFAEMTGLSIEELSQLSLLESWERLSKATTEPTTILDVLDVEKKWESIVFHDEFSLNVVDPDDLNELVDN